MKVKNFFIIEKNIATLIPMYWILYLIAIYYSPGNANLHLPATIVGTFIFVYLACTRRGLSRTFLKPVLIFIVFSIVSLLNVGNVAWYYIFFVIGHIGVSLELAISTDRLKHLYRNIYFLHILIYIIYFAVYQTFNHMYNLASENMVSVYLLLFLYLYYRECKYTGKQISVVMVGLSLILCYCGGSRTGVAIMLIAFCGICFIKLMNTKGGFIITFFLGIIAMVGVAIVGLFAYSFWIEVIQDAPRMYIWNQYLSNIDSMWNFIWGVPFYLSSAFEAYAYNLHNTFMNIHARFGLIPLIVILIIILYAISDCIKKKNWWRFLFIICYVFRSMTDNTSFSGPLDIMLFSIYFDIVSENKVFIVDSNVKSAYYRES